MSQVPVETQNGQRFFVQVEAETSPAPRRTGDGLDDLRPRGNDLGSRDDVMQPAMFSKAVEVIRGVSQEVTAGLLHTEPRPNEVELSLNLGFDAGGNIWLLRGSTNASLRLTLKWTMP